MDLVLIFPLLCLGAIHPLSIGFCFAHLDLAYVSLAIYFIVVYLYALSIKSGHHL